MEQQQQMDIMTVYWGSGCPYCWSVLLTLQEKEVPYNSRMLSFSAGEQKSPQMLALNPRGELPVVVDKDLVLSNSYAIMDYIEEFYPGPHLIPESRKARALTMMRFHELIRAGTINDLLSQGEYGLKEKWFTFRKELENMEGFLKNSSFIAGDELTLADLVLFPTLATLDRCGFQISLSFPRLSAYYNRMLLRPSVQAVTMPHWDKSPPVPIFQDFH
eukprot:GCRY01000841.1.p1 GENE.GCRY01000841.1~~GCRY01000841.1.p1  ORF type:complete len:217 (-),score=9.21 GCRY01000841.1:230-880(-)